MFAAGVQPIDDRPVVSVGLLGLAASACAVAALATFYLIKFSATVRILDYPNTRSLHTEPVPRTGGIAILGTLVVGILALTLQDRLLDTGYLLFSCAAVVALVSLLDDRFKLPVVLRLFVQASMAATVTGLGFAAQEIALPGTAIALPGAAGFLLSLFFVVWMVNLYNFMDGSDGLAGGMAVIGFACYGLMGWRAAHEEFAVLAVLVAGASCGFLIFNFPPARIFMGDAGSTLLGFLAAGFALWGARDGIFPLWAASLIFSPFIVDATLTLLKRCRRGLRIWDAHRDHYYQWLALRCGHKRVALSAYGLMTACAVSAWVSHSFSGTGQQALLGVWAMIYVLLLCYIERWKAISDRLGK